MDTRRPGFISQIVRLANLQNMNEKNPSYPLPLFNDLHPGKISIGARVHGKIVQIDDHDAAPIIKKRLKIGVFETEVNERTQNQIEISRKDKQPLQVEVAQGLDNDGNTIRQQVFENPIEKLILAQLFVDIMPERWTVINEDIEILSISGLRRFLGLVSVHARQSQYSERLQNLKF
jgi:hypothetical protein